MGDVDQKRPDTGRRAASALVESGRAAVRQRAWHDAYRQLSAADAATPLGREDLEHLSTAAYMAGRDDDYLRTLERLHRTHLNNGDDARAARAAFWLGLRLMFRGETGPATGWFGRAQRLLQQREGHCVEEGYLLLPIAEQQLHDGDVESAYATASRAAETGDRFAEADLGACARHVQGRALILRGRVKEGLALLDEAMVAVTAGELSPIMTGLVYCSVVEACQQVYALDRAREWTAALAEWCAGQPQLVTFTGTCLVHRAEIMQVNGAWEDAIEEARRASETLSGNQEQAASAAAYYQLGEVHRLHGRFADAEDAYREASRRGHDPLPGLALLRLAQGQVETATAAIRRALGGTADRLRRTRLLPAYIEIMLADDDTESARVACDELKESAHFFQTPMLRAIGAQARGAVELAYGKPQTALPLLKGAFDLWMQIEAPYLAARTRELIGIACRTLGDDDGATLELTAAHEAFETLGAAPDVARLRGFMPAGHPEHGAGLTPRELQVLRLVATGKPNKVIAAELCLSAKTIDRHLSNIFGKLNVSSRTAAAAWAFKHKVI